MPAHANGNDLKVFPEIFGKLAVLVLSMPVLMALLNTIKDFLS